MLQFDLENMMMIPLIVITTVDDDDNNAGVHLLFLCCLSFWSPSRRRSTATTPLSQSKRMLWWSIERLNWGRVTEIMYNKEYVTSTNSPKVMIIPFLSSTSNQYWYTKEFNTNLLSFSFINRSNYTYQFTHAPG